MPKYQVLQTYENEKGELAEVYPINRSSDVQVGEFTEEGQLVLPGSSQNEILKTSLMNIRSYLKNLQLIAREYRNVSDSLISDNSINIASSKSVKMLKDITVELERLISENSDDIETLNSNLEKHRVSHDHDTIYYTETEMDALLKKKADNDHASADTFYGIGTSLLYGHVKLSDKYDVSEKNGSALYGMAASQLALYNAYSALKSDLNTHASTKSNTTTFAHVKVVDEAYTNMGGATDATVPSFKAFYDKGQATDTKITNLTNTHNNDVKAINTKITDLTTKHNDDVKTINSKIDTATANSNKALNDHIADKATASKFSHVKLSDGYTSSAGNAAGAVGASSLALYNAYSALKSDLNTHASTKSNTTTFAHVKVVDEAYTNMGGATDATVPSFKAFYDKGQATDTKITNLTNTHNNDVKAINTKITDLTTKHNDDVKTINSKIDTATANSNKALNDHIADKATASKFSHVKLSDGYTSSAGNAAGAVGASSLALYNAYSALKSDLDVVRKLLAVQPDNYKDGNALPSTYPRGETIFFSNDPANRFNGVQYCTIQTIKGYSNMVCIQFLYPYNTNADKIYYRTALYNTDSWRAWKLISVDHSHPYLPLSGGTLTGALKIKGAAADKPLQVRGIVGSESDGVTLGALHLQFGATGFGIVLGNEGKYSISADGSKYTGRSANADLADKTNYLVSHAIPANADLNDYITPGLYHCTTNATVETFKNCPTNKSFSMKVSIHAGCCQEIIEYSANNGSSAAEKRFQRNYYNSKWDSWRDETVLTPVPLNAKFTDTWRGVQNNLTSTATDQSLSAAQGKILNESKLMHKSYTATVDFNTLKDTGVYHIRASGSPNAPTSHHGTLYVDSDVGTPYQIWIPDGVIDRWYKRTLSSDTWTTLYLGPEIVASNGTTDAFRQVWFSASDSSNKRNYDEDFKYNPVSNTLQVGKVVAKSLEIDDIITINKSLTLTTSWIDTGIKYKDLASGVYVLTVICNGPSADTGLYGETFAGIMYWFSDGETNASDADEILLHSSGHAKNGQWIFLRTVNTSRDNGVYQKLQIAFTKTLTAAVPLVFKFRKLM